MPQALAQWLHLTRLENADILDHLVDAQNRQQTDIPSRHNHHCDTPHQAQVNGGLDQLNADNDQPNHQKMKIRQ